ncbi:hypothetical protein K438DRAFT_2034348 [Mycena galopus ATCC 62051]|nr:hypothetical protein K438DRAFT_2034348 [Mycena galopus ATCC 62051]
MYGEDETILVPTPTEKRIMYNIWQQTPSYPDVQLSFDEATEHSRWVTVDLPDNKTAVCFTIGPPLFWSVGLFSRGTRVDRVVIKDDPNPDAYALKDAWREVCRRPEKDFYDVIKRHCEEVGHSTTGMAQCLWSVEVGHRTRLGKHATQQRCRTRSLLTPVGIPLRSFLSTRELVLGLETAVKHHQIASEAGVIHRDVSDNNVLFDGKTRQAFLFDWDHAEFTQKGKENFEAWFPERATGPQNAEYTDIDTSLKDLAGTFAFMAIDILDKDKNVSHAPKHDLESFYYLLVWMILRHTPTADGLGISHAQMCHELFDNPAAVAVKERWLKITTVICTENHPLFAILEVLRDLFMRQNARPPPRVNVPPALQQLAPPPQVLTAQEDVATYENVLAIFTRSLAMPTWPEDDGAIPFVPTDANPHTPSESLRRAAAINSAADSAARGSSRRKRGREDDAAVATYSLASPSAQVSKPAPKKFKDGKGKGKAPSPQHSPEPLQPAPKKPKLINQMKGKKAGR